MAERQHGFLHRLLSAFLDWWFGREERQRQKLERDKREIRDELESQSPSERQRTARRFVRDDKSR